MLFNIYDAKTHFSQLVNRALEGDEVIIARGGKPLLRLVPYLPDTPLPRQGGQLHGMIQIRDDFEDPLPSDLFEG